MEEETTCSFWSLTFRHTISLAYVVCKNKDAATVKSVLRQLKKLGYIPKIVLSDLAKELLTSVEEVFPDALIQGCIWHLWNRLDKLLPVKQNKKKFKAKKKEVEKAKIIIALICAAENKEKRLEELQKVKDLCASLDAKIKSIVDLSIENLAIYQTLDK